MLQNKCFQGKQYEKDVYLTRIRQSTESDLILLNIHTGLTEKPVTVASTENPLGERGKEMGRSISSCRDRLGFHGIPVLVEPRNTDDATVFSKL